MRAVGASGFPSAVVVDAQGNIAYSGHPASINASVLKPLLKGALKTPMYEWPKSCSKVAKALRKGNLGDAIKASAKIEEEHQAELDSIAGKQAQVGWGSQIRSYVMQPYQMVKDLRTEFETAAVDSVFDGDIDTFVEGYLRWRRAQGEADS